MRFQTPASELAFTARQDSIQHPYFKPLYDFTIGLIRFITTLLVANLARRPIQFFKKIIHLSI